MTWRIAGMALLLAFFAGAPHAQGVLEVPASNSSQSGIGVISGWHCSAKRIEIKIDDYPPMLAGSGTQRDDTRSVCGRTDTGYSLLFNWNILPTDCFGCRFHHVEAFADGVSFGSATFNVTSFGTEYLTGKSATYGLPNFPSIGNIAVVRWDEVMQNFAVHFTSPIPNDANWISLGGTYHGALISGPQHPACGPYDSSTFPVKHGSFVIGYSNGQLSLTANYVDGKVCRLPPVAIEPFDSNNTDGFAVAIFDQAATASCPEFQGGLKVLVNGGRLVADSMDFCRTGHLTGAR